MRISKALIFASELVLLIIICGVKSEEDSEMKSTMRTGQATPLGNIFALTTAGYVGGHSKQEQENRTVSEACKICRRYGSCGKSSLG
jgi:hypothetical protein